MWVEVKDEETVTPFTHNVKNGQIYFKNLAV